MEIVIVRETDNRCVGVSRYIETPVYNEFEIEELPQGEITDYIVKDNELVYSEDPEKPMRKIKEEVAACKQVLSDTDWIMSKMSEELVFCENMGDLNKVFKAFQQKYGKQIAERKAARERINELEN